MREKMMARWPPSTEKTQKKNHPTRPQIAAETSLSPPTCEHGLLEPVGAGHRTHQQLDAQSQPPGCAAAAGVLEGAGKVLHLVSHVGVVRGTPFLQQSGTHGERGREVSGLERVGDKTTASAKVAAANDERRKRVETLFTFRFDLACVIPSAKRD